MKIGSASFPKHETTSNGLEGLTSNLRWSPIGGGGCLWLCTTALGPIKASSRRSKKVLPVTLKDRRWKAIELDIDLGLCSPVGFLWSYRISVGYVVLQSHNQTCTRVASVHKNIRFYKLLSCLNQPFLYRNMFRMFSWHVHTLQHQL